MVTSPLYRLHTGFSLRLLGNPREAPWKVALVVGNKSFVSPGRLGVLGLEGGHFHQLAGSGTKRQACFGAYVWATGGLGKIVEICVTH